MNGRPITDADVTLRLKSDTHASEITPEVRKNALETLIRDELAYQKGVAMGLDSDPSYQDEIAKAEAHLAQLKRRKMSDLYYARELNGKIDVSDEELSKYLKEHGDDFNTDAHVMQILRRDRRSIEAAKAELDKGIAFEEVAKAPFKDADATSAWDLGRMRVGQMPKEWREPIKAMKPGEVSGIISGQKDRFWILKLVDRKKVDVNLEAEKPALVELIKGEKMAARRAAAETKIREGAKVVYETP